MESSKHVKSDSGSSEENDHQAEEVKDVTKRTYECTYCKRGFTNAQALGGHMNIHRKDRAKARQNYLHATSSIPNTPNIENKCLEPKILNDHANNSVMYQRSSMVSCPTAYDPHTSTYVHEPTTIFGLGNEEHGANLTLRIGSTYLHERDVVMQVDGQETEALDLELRLGPDP